MKTVAAPLAYGDCFFHAHKHHKKTPKQVTCLYPPKRTLLHQVNGDQLESSRGRDALATQQARAAVHVTIHTRAEGAPVEVSRIVGAATTLHIREGTTCQEISTP